MTVRASGIAIPNDLQACQALLTQQAYLVESHAQTIANLAAKVKQLEQETQEDQLTIKELLQRAFARRSERYIAAPNQLALDFGTEAKGAAEGLAEAVEEAGLTVKTHVRRQKKKRRDEGLPDHLPRYEVVAAAPDDQKECPQHGARKLIGFDTTETLEFQRPQLKVRVTKYPKYACPNAPECGVGSAERPTGLVEGDRCDASIAAEIITNKYGYHLPVYRQQDLFAGSGWAPSRSTLLHVLEASAFVLEPLVAQIRQAVLSSSILGTDDTSVTLLVPQTLPEPTPGDPKSERACERLREAAENGKPSVTARLWAYRSVTVPLAFFDFTVSRARAGPDLTLENFSGKLLADCYSGYQQIALRTAGRIERAACVAHLNVWAYVKDVLERLLAGETDYAALRPDVWAQAHPEAIRQYRREERRDKADRKQLRRATRRRASKR